MLSAAFRRSAAVATRVVAARAAVPAVTSRALSLHEYQSKDLMKAKGGLYIQQFKVATTPAEAQSAAATMKLVDGTEFVVKAQVHAGGRGKGTFSNGFKGGVHLAKTPAAVESLARSMLGSALVTKQTPPGGVVVNKVMVAEALDIDEEKYFAIVLDREHNGPVMIASPKGGMDIEAVAHESPDAILSSAIDIAAGITDAQLDQVARFLAFKTPALERQAKHEIRQLYKLFLATDMVQCEINPLGTTPTGRVLCFDAKFGFDESAEFRQREIFALHDPAEDEPREAAAKKFNLNYVAMDGNIGCLVNGAGLAMATMDIIQLYGGKPANFLDVGGSASETQVKEAFKIITSDAAVKAILVNIFGGIMRCDVIANGVVKAAREIGLAVPLVVRLAGTNVDAGKKILRESGLAIIAADDLDDAAQKACATLNKAK